MWTAIDADLPHHPKTFDLARLMAWGTPETVGRLTLLWLWALRFADDGDLREHGAHRIAGAMDVPMDDAERLLSALIEARWIDREPYLRLHGWWAQQGPFLRARWRDNADRWKRVQQLYAPTGTVIGADHEKDRKTPESPCVSHVGTHEEHTRPACGNWEQLQTSSKTKKQEDVVATATTGSEVAVEPRPVRVSPGALLVPDEAQAVVEAWNGLGRPFPVVRALGADRCAVLMSRLGEPFFTEGWREALGRMARSPFHRGGGKRGWVARFDWFLEPDSVAKLLELPDAELIDAAAAARRAAF